MNVCVIGGGNIGTTLSAELAYLNPEMSVRLLTSRPHLFSKSIEVIDVEQGTSFFGTLDVISDDPAKVVTNADVIFITTPSFLMEKTFQEIKAHVKPGAIVGVIPGSGGCEFYWRQHFDESYTLFGFERVPYITRLAVYGKSVYLKSRKPHVTLASFPMSRLDAVCNTVSDICHVKCMKAANYLTITLTPSNPVLHTSRVYDLFHSASLDTRFPKNIEFYSEWTDHASEVMLGIDSELQEMCKVLAEMDMHGVVSLKTHYESPTVSDLTRKIRSIPSFKGIYAPLILTQSNEFKIDKNSRFFTEDFPYGLCIIKGFCEICGIDTPYIDKVLQWYQEFMGVEYYTKDGFTGKDLINTAIPQNFGIVSLEDVYGFYIDEQTSPPQY
jgi:opine dehydrogenase